MRLLERKNPRATRRRVLVAAILGSVGSVLFTMIASWWKESESSPTLMSILFMGTIGAGVGAIFEWQWHDNIPDLSDE